MDPVARLKHRGPGPRTLRVSLSVCPLDYTDRSANYQVNNFGNMPYRSTTLPPDWLSMPPPNAWSAPVNSVVPPAFPMAPQQPMRYRSATPSMAPSSNYSYGSMPPPPAPMMGVPGVMPYNVYEQPPQHQEYPAYMQQPQPQWEGVPNPNPPNGVQHVQDESDYDTSAEMPDPNAWQAA